MDIWAVEWGILGVRQYEDAFWPCTLRVCMVGQRCRLVRSSVGPQRRTGQGSAGDADSHALELILVNPRYTVIKMALAGPCHYVERPVLRDNRDRLIITRWLPPEQNLPWFSKCDGQYGAVGVYWGFIVTVWGDMRDMRVIFCDQEAIRNFWYFR